MKKKRIGVFGVFRGLAYIKAFQTMDEVEVTAILDKDEKMIERAREYMKGDVKVVSTFDELLDSGIDAVVLCNYFPEHARYAVKALSRNISVFSECTPAATLKECVELVEAAEKSEGIYVLAENYPWFRANMEMKRVYESGMLGKVIFAEGEYVHPMSDKEQAHYTPDPTHWRANNPKTYYSTHALAPLMAATGLMPKKVIGKVAGRPNPDGEGIVDAAGIMLVEMEGGALFRISGSCSFGGHGNWYRLGCEKGGIESLRGTNDKVRLVVNDWCLTEENRMFGTECEYTPELTELGKKAMDSGHSGGDWWVCRHFVDALAGREKPFMDAVRSASISAVGILGWRSVLEESKQLDIPDFTKKEDRDRVREDDLNPFATFGRPASIGHRYYN